ncbi:MAG: 50S ribosomal protein L25 [Patescibacteria group bacterium]|jgi:large subunit ribosomal protein L25
MTLKLQAKIRTANKTEKIKIRKSGLIPAVLYGHGIKNQNLSVEKKVFEKIYREAGESTIIETEIEGQHPVKALIQDVTRHPTTGDILHVDFYQIRMDEKITHDIPLSFVGESKAVKELGGILVKNLSTLSIRCLPADLPSELTVDISILLDFESRITVAELIAPKGVEILAKPEEVLAVVEPPRSEEELKALDEKVEEKIEEVEKVEKEKKEEEPEVEGTEKPKAETKPEKK